MSQKVLSVFLKLNSKAFTGSLKKVERRMKKFGGKLKSIGSSLTTSVSLPLIGIAAASVKTASDFEKSMTKIETLVGLPKAAVNELSDAVLDLAGRTATAPQELADGLYFLTSAGLDAESAMEALEASAKGSASGLGDMEALATVASAAQNAYGKETLTASKALDIFGTMVQSGMFKSEELANVLGSQLGLASNLGISMEELGAMIATYTRTTGSATDATTGLSGVMMTFAKLDSEPTKQQAAALDKIGMSAKDVKAMLGEQGLLATLQHLQTEFNSNGVSMASMFSKSQALKGVLGVLGNQTESYTEILGNMEGAQGFVNNAFETTSETSAFKFNQALTDLKVAGIELGAQLLPIATKIAKFFSEAAKKFSSMSDSAKSSIVGVGIALTVLGPALMIIGTVITTLAGLIPVISTIVSAITAAAGYISAPVIAIIAAVGAVGIAIGAVVGVLAYNIYKDWDKVKVQLANVVNWFINLYNESMLFRWVIESFKAKWKSFFAIGKAVIDQIIISFKGLVGVVTNLFDPQARKKAWQEFKNSTVDNFDDLVKDIKDITTEGAKNIRENVNVELITPEDIDNTIERGKEMGAGLIDGIKTKVGDLSSQLTGMLGLDNLGLGGGGFQFNAPGTTDPTDPQGGGDSGGTTETTGADGEPPQWMTDLKTNWEETIVSMEENVNGFLTGMGEGFADTIATTIVEGENLRDAMGNFVNDMIKQIGQLIIKMLVMKALMAVINPGGAALGGGGGLMSLFGFAQGGLVTGPTVGMVGEGSNINLSNPEVIAPLSDLQQYIGGGSGRLSGMIQGSDIMLSNERSTASRYRVAGSTTEF